MPTVEEDRIRITARVPASLHHRLEEAAELSGASLSQFIVDAAAAKAQELIEREILIRLTREDAKRVFELIENPPKANKFLKDSIKAFKENVRV
jgi:uncharacterized protein (DUF1778 family)